jgi:uncharacterized protein YjbI with pentapeptide repeats
MNEKCGQQSRAGPGAGFPWFPGIIWMPNKELLEILKQGVKVWNEWREEHPSVEPDLFHTNLSFVNLNKVNLRLANISESNLKKTKFWGANFSGANLSFCDLSGALLRGANLRGANLTESDVSWANISKAILWSANLWGARLEGADLRGSNLRGAKLWGTDLKRANLGFSDLSEADLSEADLSEADLSYVNLWGANLNDAKLHKTRLKSVYLSTASFNQTDFSEAILDRCTFGDVDLSLIKGFDTVHHYGPSTIGVDTVYRSKANIPEPFLRGCGVPEDMIAYLSKISSKPVSFYSNFIIYDDADREFAEKLKADLTQREFRCWAVPESERDRNRIRPTIRFVDKMILIISKNAVQKGSLNDEAKHVLEEEARRRKKILFPIGLDSSIMDVNEPWGETVRKSRLTLNFAKWREPAAYEKAFQHLLQELRVQPVTRQKIAAPRTDEGKKRAGEGFEDGSFTVIWENSCPMYELGDRMKLTGHGIVFPDQKPACIILVEDVLESLIHHDGVEDNDKFAFNCSGCVGSVRIGYKKVDRYPAVKTAVEEPDREIDTLVSLLGTFSMFQSLDEHDIRYLVSFLKMKEFRPGEIIIKKGDPGRNLFIIVSGQIEVLGDGGISIAFMGKGDVFGEMSLLSGSPAGATIQVVEPTKSLFLNGVDFRKVLNKFPSLQMYFTRLLARRLAEIHDVRSEEFQSGMVGKLSEMPPSELFQTLNINQKTGILTLTLQSGSAELLFNEGNLVQAEYNGKSGIEAFNQLLREKEGRFKFTPGLSKADMELNPLGDFMWLLMEGMRTVDESEVALEMEEERKA